jgi:hypothetical protein
MEGRGLYHYFQIHGIINDVWQDDNCTMVQAHLVQSGANSITGPGMQQLFRLMVMFMIREL